ncbi:MAG: hypothetical protein K5905_28225 [Roseibium sp.]|uniref:hypothetical protein n=1 Tax=Roseibium sp. TaxID=1936156 RepID=UPI00260E237E|nr:hypothetical protein [Roseibium sp.]MCV0429353.1 hypothetical protein [Roseibium sp.]
MSGNAAFEQSGFYQNHGQTPDLQQLVWRSEHRNFRFMAKPDHEKTQTVFSLFPHFDSVRSKLTKMYS